MLGSYSVKINSLVANLPVLQGQGVNVGGGCWRSVEPPLHESTLRPLAEVSEKGIDVLGRLWGSATSSKVIIMIH